MDQGRLAELEQAGWRITRDGSTATAHYPWDDADDPESGWEVLVLHTAGHGARFTLNAFGSGLAERSLPDVERLAGVVAAAVELLRSWHGELPGDPSADRSSLRNGDPEPRR
jgi:hypothetical protein